jgi:hypothetical protein
MKQILELRYDLEEGEGKVEFRKGSKVQRKLLRKPSYPIKLSRIWEKASKELTQIKIEFGNPSTMEACAMGAISYYLSDKKTCLLSELPHPWQKAVFRDMVKTFESKSRSSIWELNDLQGWTFAQFAEKAIELSL